MWPSLNSILVWALALVNEGMAWDEWKKNSLARHAEVYPDLWYGIWSGPDSYYSVLPKNPVQGSPVFPVMNMHSHSDQLYATAKLLGVEFTEKGLHVSPTLPLASYSFESPLVGIAKSGRDYKGWYAPSVAGTWTVTLRLAPDEAERVPYVEVNGVRQTVRRIGHRIVELDGESVPGKRLQWSMTTDARP